MLEASLLRYHASHPRCIHKAQKTEACWTSVALTLHTYQVAGCVSLIQPLDTSLNKPFKNAVERLATEHIPGSVCEYVKGELISKCKTSPIYKVGWPSMGGCQCKERHGSEEV